MILVGALPVPVEVDGTAEQQAWLEPLVIGTGKQIPLATWFKDVNAFSGPVDTFTS